MPRLPLILSLCLLLPYAPAPTTAAGPRDSLVVSTAWLAAHLHDPNLVILHVGDKARYDSKHIRARGHFRVRSLGDRPDARDATGRGAPAPAGSAGAV